LSPHTQEISSTETVLQEDRESTYYVQAGDTLTSIAAKIGVGAGDLRRENGLQSDLIRVGQGLKVPPHQTETAAAEEDASTDQIADVLPDSEEQTY
jgi:LysM repeat protein